ncbi:HD-GYP domain-containing protein [Paenibacillus beijingensis]|uniref:Uncharacterized protein n=1 Tax=Paenibacillus beijingensis TaxID=1126833 RepID=A0A0D5NI81_9BACL|nr:HD-GYP domain-containing protein [Paenibacillus beijingensis]AJY74820.1 hypothetical protein VN24_09765 [Paenibacillus beijingensis]
MKDEWARWTQDDEFCPIALRKYGVIFWSLFFMASAVAIVLNVLFDSELLLGLYVYPVVLLATLDLSGPLLALIGAALLGTVFAVNAPDPVLIVVAASYAVLLLIVRRVVWISARHYKGKKEQEDLLMNTILSLGKTIDARDPYTAFHSHNVAEYARSIAKEMGLSHKEQDAIFLGGLIHDIGKIGTPDAILQKESRLTEGEYAIMKKHPEEGYQIVKNMKRLRELGITDMVRYHHERPDGNGYPAGLKGAGIPLGARILGVADAFDAMTTNRSYRQKLTVETAAEELRRNSGTQFDPAAASAFLAVLTREGKLQPEKPAFSASQAKASLVN